MKKLLAILLILALMLCAVGCQTSGNYGSDTNFNSDANSDSATNSEDATNSEYNMNFEIDENLESDIKKAFIEQRPVATKNLTGDDLSIDSYGTYNGCTVGYINGPFAYLQALSGEKVGPYIFQYVDSQKMLAYKDGLIKSMKEAYALGWLDDDAVKQIHEKHKQEHPLLYHLTPYSIAGTATVYGIEESVIDEYLEKYPKIYDVPAEDSEFADDRVIICVYPFANAYEFTPEDFSELQSAVNVQCIAVETISSTSTDAQAEEPTRLLALTLKDGSRSDVVRAITHLRGRYDIYYAQADYAIGSN